MKNAIRPSRSLVLPSEKEDYYHIAHKDIMITPRLLFDGEVVAEVRVIGAAEIKEMIARIKNGHDQYGTYRWIFGATIRNGNGVCFV